jgi:hypothetical protein
MWSKDKTDDNSIQIEYIVSVANDIVAETNPEDGTAELNSC